LAEENALGILGDVSRLVAGAFGDVAKSAVGLSGELLSGSQDLSSYSKALSINTPLLKEMGGAIQGLTQFAEANLAEYQTLSGIGATFGAEMTEIKSAAADLGITVEEMIELFQKNNIGLAAFGGTVDQSITAFREVANKVLSVDSDVGRNLRRLGLSVSDINESLLAFAEINKVDPRQALNDATQLAAFEQMVVGIDTIAQLTGESRDSLLEAQITRNRQGDIQAFGITAGAEAQAQLVAAAGDLDRTLGQNFGDLLTDLVVRGTPTDETTKALAAALGDEFGTLQALADEIKAGTASTGDIARAMGQLTARTTERDFAQIAQLRGVGGPIADVSAQALEDSLAFRRRITETMEQLGVDTSDPAIEYLLSQIEDMQLDRVADDANNSIQTTIGLQTELRELVKEAQGAGLPALEEVLTEALNIVSANMPGGEEIGNTIANTVGSILDVSSAIYNDAAYANARFETVVMEGGLLTPSDIAAIGAALNEGSNIFGGNQQSLVDKLQTLNATEADLLNNPQGLSPEELQNTLSDIDRAQADLISRLEELTGIDLDGVQDEINRLEGRIGSYEDMLRDQAGIEQGLIDPEEIQNTIDSLTEDLRLNTAISNAEMSSALKDAAETMSTTNETPDSNAEISSALKDAAETMSTTNETPETEESNTDEISSNIQTQNQQISDLMAPTLEQNQILSDIVSLLMADQNLNKRQLAALKSQQGNLYRGVG
jgi:hypothetical protein